MADSSATTLSLHSDEGYSRSVVPSTQDAIPIFTRLDAFNTLCHSKKNRWEPQLREGKGAISATSFVFSYFSLSDPVKHKGRRSNGQSNPWETLELPRQGALNPSWTLSFHSLRPSHLLGNNHNVEIAIKHPSPSRGPQTCTGKQHNWNLSTLSF